ncbi:phage virion morphogenesis protein [Oligella urethralis]|uniref:phage virion morphogenesis protein n=1 Tax=Oligella urethralis TaxID=90245 RepID=UPI00288C58E8|nr:phage virion morphogenesis protein [Oligella urethralis]
MIEIRVDVNEINDAFDTLVKGLRNTSPLMQEVAHVMNTAVSENFEHGGRPKWLGKWDGTASKLQDTGRLRNSITRIFDTTTAVVGTNVIYAGIHQFGGAIRPKRAKALRFNGRFASQVTMPARPFLKLEPEDFQEIELIGQEYLQSLIS